MKTLVAASIFLPMMALSQTNVPSTAFTYPLSVLCDRTSKVMKVMEEYKERQSFIATEENGSIISLWKNEDTGSYTLFKTTKSGDISCILSIGYEPKKL